MICLRREKENIYKFVCMHAHTYILIYYLISNLVNQQGQYIFQDEEEIKTLE